MMLWIALLLTCLGGCSREPVAIDTPKAEAAIAEPFLTALRRGNRAEAEKFVALAARDELDGQFDADHKILAVAPALTPRFITPEGSRQNYRDGSTETSIVFAGQKDGKWTSVTMRLFRDGDAPFAVEYWRVENAAPVPVLQSTEEAKIMREMAPGIMWSMIALAVVGAIGLVAFLMLVLRRPSLFSPDTPADGRVAATTVREDGEDGDMQ
jgi:hypothetical protein